MPTIACVEGHWFDINATSNPSLASQAEQGIAGGLDELQCPTCAWNSYHNLLWELDNYCPHRSASSDDKPKITTQYGLIWGCHQCPEELQSLFDEIEKSAVDGLIRISSRNLVMVNGFTTDPEDLEDMYI